MSSFEIGIEFVENEVTLIGRLQVGSEEAFEALIHLYQAPVYNIAFRVLGDPAEASDAVQETFMKIYKGIKTFRGECGLRTWIYKIAISSSLNRQRWWKRWRHHAPISLDEPFSCGEFELADPRPDPESSLAKMETERAVQRALNMLDVDYRIVIVLRDIEGFSYDEITDILKISPGTVKSRLWRARQALKKELQPFVYGKA